LSPWFFESLVPCSAGTTSIPRRTGPTGANRPTPHPRNGRVDGPRPLAAPPHQDKQKTLNAPHPAERPAPARVRRPAPHHATPQLPTLEFELSYGGLASAYAFPTARQPVRDGQTGRDTAC